MKRKHLNALLALAVAGLAAAAWFAREKPEPPPPPLTSLSVDAIRSIRIQHSGSPDIRLEKRKDGWWLVTPVETRAEPMEVNGILDLASRPSQRRYTAKEMNLAELGLAEPRWHVEFNDVKIALGDTDPIEARRYVHLGHQVHLIEDPPSAALDAEYQDLISRRLVAENARLLRVEVPGLVLSRNEKEGWDVRPAAADKGADAAQKLADAWQHAQAMWITPRSKLRPQGEVKLKTDREELRFEILDREDQLILARPELGVQFTLPKNLAADLFTLQTKDATSP